MGEHILVVEDEQRIADFLRRGLTFEGFRVSVAGDGLAGLATARDDPPDLVLLDVMLPGLDGLEVCKRLRAASAMPIIMLTAKEAVPDRVAGLNAGADDYVIKPVAFDELVARIRAQLRRTQPHAEILHVVDLTMDTSTREVRRGERKLELTSKEYTCSSSLCDTRARY